MKRLLPLFLLAFAVRAGAETYTSPELGFTFPAKLAGMEQQAVTDYEKKNPGLGVGISYRAPDQKADFYIYNLRQPSLPNGAASPLIHQHFNQIKNEIVTFEKTGQYQNVSFPVISETVAIGNLEFLHSEMAFDQEGTPRVSHIYLTVVKGQFFKIRYTINAKEAEPVAALQKFLADTALILTAKNTF